MSVNMAGRKAEGSNGRNTKQHGCVDRRFTTSLIKLGLQLKISLIIEYFLNFPKKLECKFPVFFKKGLWVRRIVRNIR